MRRNFIVNEIANLDVKKGRLVHYVANANAEGGVGVQHATSANHAVVGVTDTAAKAGERVDVIYAGIALVEMGQVLTAPGYPICPDASGRGMSSVYYYQGRIGTNRTMVAAVGDFVEVLMR